MKKIISLLLIISTLMINGTVFASTPSNWAKSDVEAIKSMDFLPTEVFDNYTQNISRLEFAKIAVHFVAYKYNTSVDSIVSVYCDKQNKLGNALESRTNVFSDCKDKYADAAYTMNIVRGTGNGTFEPARNITRQEAAKMLASTIMAVDEALLSDNNIDEVSVSKTFSDWCTVASWAKSDCLKMYQNGIMKGTNANSFTPLGYYTKEQCLSTFLRLANIGK